MKRLNQLAANLYPRWWRDRYGAEFAVLLDDTRPGLAGTIDICKGAAMTQISTFTWPRTLAVFTLLGILASAGIAYSIRSQYVSEASFRVSPVDSAVYPIFRQVQTDNFSDARLQEIIRGRNLYPEERKSRPMEELVQKLRDSIAVIPYGTSTDGGQLFVVRSSYPDRVVARNISQDVITLYVDGLVRDLGRSLRARGASEEEQMLRRNPIYVIKAPTLPMLPESPNRLGIVATGAAGGACLGALLVLLFRQKRGEPQPPTGSLQASAI